MLASNTFDLSPKNWVQNKQKAVSMLKRIKKLEPNIQISPKDFDAFADSLQ